MEERELLEKLQLREIKPTAMRLLILKTMLETEEAVSLLDLENRLDTVDRSTIFRTVMLFLAHHLVHCVDDGSGSLKYAVCDNSCTCSVDDLHTHFYCESCHRTFCLNLASRFHPPERELRDEGLVRGVLCAQEMTTLPSSQYSFRNHSAKK